MLAETRNPEVYGRPVLYISLVKVAHPSHLLSIGEVDFEYMHAKHAEVPWGCVQSVIFLTKAVMSYHNCTTYNGPLLCERLRVAGRAC